jgi:hypothetical protein
VVLAFIISVAVAVRVFFRSRADIALEVLAFASASRRPQAPAAATGTQGNRSLLLDHIAQPLAAMVRRATDRQAGNGCAYRKSHP